MVTKERAQQILLAYEQAWVEQDIEKILSIFHQDGIYHERVFKDPHVGHEQIAQYWKEKVCEEQSNIVFKLLNFYIEESTLIAEWDASFDSNVQNCKIRIKEIAILEIENGLVRSLREYWQSEKKPLA